MQTWEMIELRYARIPKTQNYHASLAVTKVVADGERVSENSVQGFEIPDTSMEEMITTLHHTLQLYPEAKVTMIRELTRPGIFRTENTKGFELSPEEVNILRSDLPKALLMFSPIEQTVKVQVSTPSVELGMNGE